MRNSLVLLFGLLAAVVPVRPAEAGEVLLRVDRGSMAQGGSVQAQVEIRGEAAGSPTLPATPGLEVVPVGQRSNFTMSQGRVDRSTTFLYQVRGLQPGEFQLGPASAQVDGKRQQSEPTVLRVMRPSRPEGGSADSAGKTKGSKPVRRGGDAFALARVTDEAPYVGESVTYALEVGFAVRVRAPNWQQPSWGAMTQEPGVEQVQVERPEVIDGRRYDINTVRVPLFGVEPGPTIIPAAALEVGVVERGFGLLTTTRPLQLRSDPVVLQVRPLPTTERPANFSGAVGQFRLQGSLDRVQLEAGETVTLSLEVVGQGALRGMNLKLDAVDSLRVYDEDPEVKTNLSANGLRSRAVYRKALVPLVPGRLTIPAVVLSYFDPQTEAYAEVRAGPFVLEVTGEPVTDPAVLARSTALATAKEEVEILGSDILPLHLGKHSRGVATIHPTSAPILALLLLPVLAFAGIATKSRSDRMAGTERGQVQTRRKQAREARQRAKAAAKGADIEAAEAALRTYLGARLNRSGQALSPSEAPQLLRAAGEGVESANEAARILDALEALRYGGGSAEGLAEAVHRWVEATERNWT